MAGKKYNTEEQTGHFQGINNQVRLRLANLLSGQDPVKITSDSGQLD